MTKVKNTFLELDEPEQEEVQVARRRCKSAPPAMKDDTAASVAQHRMSDEVAAECAQHEEVLLILPKDILGHDAQTKAQRRAIPAAVELEAFLDLPAMTGPAPRQPGSVGHPDICRRPCLFFNAGNCTNGTACEYCHLPHDVRTPHLDKRQRALVGNLSEVELMNLLLINLQARAKLGGFTFEALEVMEALRERAGLLPGAEPEMPRIPRQCQSKLLYMMQKMSFQSLLGLALKSRYATQAFVEDVSGALARMRSSMLSMASAVHLA